MEKVFVTVHIDRDGNVRTCTFAKKEHLADSLNAIKSINGIKQIGWAEIELRDNTK